MENLPKEFDVVWVREYVHIGLVIIKLPGDALKAANQQAGHRRAVCRKVELEGARGGDADELGFTL